ncbi:MAG: HpsJ family protein [Cyanobacteriota bacterium]|nr:HpsJ family protein [Cyanobacteriota bacterium]
MKATTSRQFPSLAAWSVKLIGTILIVSSLIDYLILLIPPNLQSRAWQLSVTSNLVDRGIVPMVGMGLVLVGFWMDNVTSGGSQKPIKPFADLRFWIAIIASVLGLMYLLLFPLHLNNTRLARSQAISQIDQQASQAETQLEARLGSDVFQQRIEQQKTALRTQFNSLLQDEERLNEFLAREDIPQPIKDVLQEARTNPQALDQFLEQQADNLPTQVLTRIREEKQRAEQREKTRFLKSSLQTGISSLLLAIGYVGLGWTGLKASGILGGSRRKPSAG